MKVRADFSKREVVYPDDYNWVDAPSAGVQRMMLDRDGDEIARATTIVKFAPNSDFKPHAHDGGEEFIVLDGVFSDEHADYGVGCYVRNPVGTHHTPKIGDEGATILVKLHQMTPYDNAQKVIDTASTVWYQGSIDGLEVMPLHNFETENVALVKWAPNTIFNPHIHWGGEEIFVLEGTFYDDHGTYPKGSWIRSPHKSKHHPFTKQDGATILVKTGHLPIE